MHCLTAVIAMEGAGETHRYSSEPSRCSVSDNPNLTRSLALCLLLFDSLKRGDRCSQGSEFLCLVKEGAERSSRMLEHRNTLGLAAFIVITGRGRACTRQEHHPSDKIARNPCRLELAEFPILEAGFFLLINSWCGITLGIAWRHKLYHILNWNANPAKARVKCSSNQQVLSCLARGSVRKKTRQKWKREGNLLSRFSSVYTEGAWQCKMRLVWTQSPLGLVSSRWGDIRCQIPIGPLGGRGGWGAPGNRKVESLSSILLQVVKQHMRLDM